MPRYLPVQIDAANEPIKQVYAEVQHKLGHVPNFLKTVAHNDRILKPMADAFLSFVGESSLSEKVRQLVILRVCQLDKCKPTVDRHTLLAKQAGWSDDHLKAMDDYNQSELFPYYEKEALRLVELVRSTPDEIPGDYWAQLDNHYTSDQIVEMVALIGFIGMINHLILALQIEPDPPAAV
ncbi:MAG: hypothetical protein EHM18_08375 [Acidobacteria bacterium]|nr:MAG: hypothetical protein EHM18_08375 [Acidobacteriota bacterium]